MYCFHLHIFATKLAKISDTRANLHYNFIYFIIRNIMTLFFLPVISAAARE